MLTINGTFIKHGDDIKKLEDAIAEYNALEKEIEALKEEKEKRDKEMMEVKTLNATLQKSAQVTPKSDIKKSYRSLMNFVNGMEDS